MKLRAPLNVWNVTGVWPNEGCLQSKCEEDSVRQPGTPCGTYRRLRFNSFARSPDVPALSIADVLLALMRAVLGDMDEESPLADSSKAAFSSPLADSSKAAFSRHGSYANFVLGRCARTSPQQITMRLTGHSRKRETQKTITKRLRQVRKQRDEKVDEMRSRGKASAVAPIRKKKGKSQIKQRQCHIFWGPPRWETSAETLRAENHPRSMMGLT